MIIPYLLYLLVSGWLTIIVGNSLHRNGEAWIMELMGDLPLSKKINNILLLGYRLINFGYILLTLMNNEHGLDSIRLHVEFLATKLGLIITILGGLHLQNILLLFIFSKLKTKYKWEI